MTSSIKTAFLLGLLTALIIVVGTTLGGRGGAMLALIFAAGMNFFSYWFSDRVVLDATRALEKLDQYSRRVPLAVGGGASMNHLFIVQPFLGRGMRSLFSTHPPIAERIRRLLGR